MFKYAKKLDKWLFNEKVSQWKLFLFWFLFYGIISMLISIIIGGNIWFTVAFMPFFTVMSYVSAKTPMNIYNYRVKTCVYHASRQFCGGPMVPVANEDGSYVCQKAKQEMI